MTVAGTDGIEPRRLGELVDGATPRDEAERRMTGLMAALRAAEPPAPEALRLRVRRLAAAPAPAGAVGSWRARLRPADRRRMALMAAPVAAAIAAAAVAVPVLTSSDQGPSGRAPVAAGDAPAAPEAAPAEGNAPALSAARARAIAIVGSVGGTTVSVSDPRGAGIVRIVFRVPAARADEALAALGRLGHAASVRRRAVEPSRARLATLELTLAAGASP